MTTGDRLALRKFLLFDDQIRQLASHKYGPDIRPLQLLIIHYDKDDKNKIRTTL